MGLRQIVIDAWSWLNYKPVYSDDARGMPNRRAFPGATAMWVPAADERRLAAYKLLAAYDNNQVAEITDVTRPADQDGGRETREFGDPAMFVDTLLADVLGREQHITVPGAEQDTAGSTDLDAAMALRVQELLQEWAEDELLAMRMQQCERNAVALGDGVYRMAWEPGKARPTVRVHDPGFYFPVIGEDADGGDYPARVHFAWELPEDKPRGLEKRLRRFTYELDWISPATASGLDGDGRPVRALLPPPAPESGKDGDDAAPAGPVLGLGDTLDPTSGAIMRQYPWNDTPSAVTCYLTDATWKLSDLTGPLDVDSLPLNKATYATRADGEVLQRLDLLIDFIPVVHVPNTVPPPEEHWGRSSLGKVLQVFDELAGTDTDSAKASATTGSPMVAFSGRNTVKQDYTVGPGVAFGLGEGGRMDTLDTSPQLAELRARTGELQDRAASNARLPAVSLGTADPSKFPSGYAMQLALGPLDSLIASMRLARTHKYRLLLKFTQRMFLAGQHPDWAGVTVQPAEIVFGPYTPTDKQAVLDQVAAGVGAGVLSVETAVRMLKDAGFPIEDIDTEIQQIQSRRFADAVALADATGSADAVSKFLGIKFTPDPIPPAPQLPPTPGQDPPGQTGGTPSSSTNTAPGRSGGSGS